MLRQWDNLLIDGLSAYVIRLCVVDGACGDWRLRVERIARLAAGQCGVVYLVDAPVSPLLGPKERNVIQVLHSIARRYSSETLCFPGPCTPKSLAAQQRQDKGEYVPR